MGRVLRRALGGLVVSGLLVTALAFYVYSPYLSLTSTQDGPATSAESGLSTLPGKTTAVSTSSPTPIPSPTAPAREAGSPSSAGGRQPGLRLVATVLAGGVFEVTETVRLPAPVSTLTLAPPDLRAAGGDLRSAHPMATDVVVRVDDQSVPLPRGTVQRATTIAFHRPTDRFEIRYRLHGSVRVNRPSTAGRAVGAVAPLASRLPGDLPVAVAFRGEAVRNVSCVGLPLDQRTCFAGRRPNVRVDQNLPYRAALVLVQLDLQAAVRKGRR